MIMLKTLAITLGILAMAIPAKGKGGGKRGEPTADQKKLDQSGAIKQLLS